MNTKKKSGSFKRTMYYFWKALMQYKVRTILVLLLVPTWIFISNVLVPFGTSSIVGQLSTGDFEISNYVGILLLTAIVLFSVFLAGISFFINETIVPITNQQSKTLALWSLGQKHIPNGQHNFVLKEEKIDQNKFHI